MIIFTAQLTSMAVNSSLISNHTINPCKNKLCKACGLYLNQKPLFSNRIAANIFWVGLSAVQIGKEEDGVPLAPNTRTGNLIYQIEHPFIADLSFYKTNLVKCVPLKDGKIRYPASHEMQKCFPNLQEEIQDLKPSIIFLLGKQVASFILQRATGVSLSLSDNFSYDSIFFNGVKYVPVHHPSYVLVYKRKMIEKYISSIQDMFSSLLINV